MVLPKVQNISSDSATPVIFNIITIKLTGVELSNKKYNTPHEYRILQAKECLLDPPVIQDRYVINAM